MVPALAVELLSRLSRAFPCRPMYNILRHAEKNTIPRTPHLELAHITADGTSVELRDGTSVVLRDGTSVVLRDGTSVVLRDGTSVVLRNGTSVEGLRVCSAVLKFELQRGPCVRGS